MGNKFVAYFLTIFSCIIGAEGIKAQSLPSGIVDHFWKEQEWRHRTLLDVPEGPGTAKTTGSLASRLIASSEYRFTGTEFEQTDTTSYTYTGARNKTSQGYWAFDKCYSAYTSEFLGVKAFYDQEITATYDAEAARLSYEEMIYSGGKLTGTEHTYSYGPEKRMTSFRRRMQYTATPGMNLDSTFFYFNMAGADTATLFLKWNSDLKAWKNISLRTKTLDAALNITEKNFQIWDSLTSAWIIESKEQYEYDTKGILATKVVMELDRTSTRLENQIRQTYIYDLSGHLTEMLNEYWDTTTLSWSIYGKSLLGYSGEHLISDLNMKWNKVSLDFDSSTLYSYAYDVYGNRTMSSFEMIEEHLFVFYEQDKILTTYDARGNKIMIIKQVKNNSKEWENRSRTRQAFNTYDQLTKEDHDSWDRLPAAWNHAKKDLVGYYYYEEHATTIAKSAEKKNTVKVYPVPATNELHIDITLDHAQDISIVLFDMAGRKWMEQTRTAVLQLSESVSTGFLPTGNYIIKVTGSKHAQLSEHIQVIRP